MDALRLETSRAPAKARPRPRTPKTFKSENGDDSSQHDPSCVPMGAGVVSAKLNASAALAASPDISGENVNYAVKSSFLLSFLESVPEVSAKLKAPVTVDRKFEDVVKSAQDAAVLVLVY